jgi:hypothetical protein
MTQSSSMSLHPPPGLTLKLVGLAGFPAFRLVPDADSRVRALSDSEHHLIEMIGAASGSETVPETGPAR